MSASYSDFASFTFVLAVGLRGGLRGYVGRLGRDLPKPSLAENGTQPQAGGHDCAMASFLRANTRSRYLEGALAQYGTAPLPIAKARFGVHPISLPLKRRVLAGEAEQPQASPRGMHESANALGSAVVTTVYFKQVTQGGAHAVTVSVAIVGAVILACLGIVWLLPKKAVDEEH